jgi:hypothetical protein
MPAYQPHAAHGYHQRCQLRRGVRHSSATGALPGHVRSRSYQTDEHRALRGGRAQCMGCVTRPADVIVRRHLIETARCVSIFTGVKRGVNLTQPRCAW